MVSNLYCDDTVYPPSGDDNAFSSLSGIEDAVFGQPSPGGDDDYAGGGYVSSGVSSGTYINVIDQLAGMSNLMADETWMGGSYASTDNSVWEQGWSVSDVSGAPRGGVFGKIRDEVINSTASGVSGMDALIDVVWFTSGGGGPDPHTSGIDASGYQITQLQQAIAGNSVSGLIGIYDKSVLINNNIVELQDIMASGVSATVGDVTIVGNSTDFATQTTLAAINTKVATDAKLDDIIADTNAIETAVESIDTKVATASNQGNIYTRLGNILADTSEITDIKTSTALTQAGLSAVNIRASDGTSITETSNALDVFVKGGDSGGGPMNVAVESVFGSESSMGVSSAGNLPISLETNNAGNLNMNIAAVGVGLGVYSSQPTGVEITNPEGGCLSVSAFDYASGVFLDEDSNGDNPQSNTTIIAAPGAAKRIVIDGYNITVVGSSDTAYGQIIIHDGNLAGGETTGSTGIIFAARSQGTTPTAHGYSGMTPIGLAENAALKFSTTEGSAQMYVYGSIQFRIVAL